MSFGLEQTSVA